MIDHHRGVDLSWPAGRAGVAELCPIA